MSAAPAIHPTRRIHGWTVEEEAQPDGLHKLVCRKGNRLMDLSGTPDTAREVLYERGIEALISDDAHWAVRLGDRRGVQAAETALRRHRQTVATRRLQRIRDQVERSRQVLLYGRTRGVTGHA